MLKEPTTGLDSSHAYDMMRMLKSYTEKERKTVIITIHQPSSQIFHMFDKILLLSEGEVSTLKCHFVETKTLTMKELAALYFNVLSFHN